MSRRHQLQRQWEIIRYLEAGGAPTLADLADLIRVPEDEPGRDKRWSESTLRRDLEELIREGFPILRQMKGGIRWRFPDGFRRSVPGPFLPTDLMALYYARRGFDAYRETPFRDTFRTLLNTVEKLIPRTMREFLDRIDEHFGPYLPAMKSVAAHQRVMEQLAQAADDRRCVELWVHPPDRHRGSWRRVDPYGVWYHLGRTLLMGRSHETGRIEPIPVETVREVRSTDDVFQLPLDIDFGSVLMGGRGGIGGDGGGHEVVIRASGDAAERVREAMDRGWLAGASKEDRPADGETGEAGTDSLRVRFSAADLNAARSWVLSLGGGVEVISPEELRRDVIRTVEEARARYRAG